MSLSNALRQIGFYAGMILIVLAVYVLSFGPAIRLYHTTTISGVKRVIEVVYYPLDAAAGSVPGGGIIVWYAELWDAGLDL